MYTLLFTVTFDQFNTSKITC